MREIVFDTETTGLDRLNDRVIEIGGIEIDNRFPTGRSFHVYINPDGRSIHPDALAVHGLSEQKLAGKPVFAAIADEFLAFIDGARLVAHNATFDIGFINAELARLGHPAIADDRVVDTLALARRRHPMGPNSLDALCRRYGIDNAHRTLHGALLDSQLLADVYIELIGGRQAALGLSIMEETVAAADGAVVVVVPRPMALPPRLTGAERGAHATLVEKLGPQSLWARLALSRVA